MGFLTDSALARARRVAKRPELPGWWAFVPVAGGVAIGVFIVVGIFSSDPAQPGARWAPTTVEQSPAAADPFPSLGPGDGSPASVPAAEGSSGAEASVDWQGLDTSAVDVVTTVAVAHASGDYSQVPSTWPVVPIAGPQAPAASVTLSKVRVSAAEDGSIVDVSVRAVAPAGRDVRVSVLLTREGAGWVPLSATASS